MASQIDHSVQICSTICILLNIFNSYFQLKQAHGLTCVTAELVYFVPNKRPPPGLFNKFDPAQQGES
ncbi:hypothetical protein, partial [Staphylococcus simulans]